MAKIAFIGLGHMGSPMVSNLLKFGHDLTVFDIALEAMQPLIAKGARSVASMDEIAKEAEFVITMLQTSEQVSRCCLGERGIFAQLSKEAIYIDCSSIAITTTQALHQEAEQLGLLMLDAPVSGGVHGAECQTLTFMVGGADAAFARANPILANMGKVIIYAGKAGHGQAAKICNNMILGISMIAVSEAFTLAERLGLSADKFFEISSQSSGACWAMLHNCPAPHILPEAPSSHDYKPGFAAKMMLKDLKLSQDAARHVGLNTELGAQAEKIYQNFFDQNQGDLDFSAIIQELKIKNSEGH